MWKNLLKSFERSMVITPGHFSTSCQLIRNGKLEYLAGNNHIRPFASSTALRNTEEARTDETSASFDAEYIVPYKSEYEKRGSAQVLVDTLRTRFRLNSAEVKQILNYEDLIKSNRKKSMLGTLDILIIEGVNRKSFLDNPWIIAISESRYQWLWLAISYILSKYRLICRKCDGENIRFKINQMLEGCK